jgi:hypothetical protein
MKRKTIRLKKNKHPTNGHCYTQTTPAREEQWETGKENEAEKQ